MRCVDGCAYCEYILWNGAVPAVCCSNPKMEGCVDIDPHKWCYFAEKVKAASKPKDDVRQGNLFGAGQGMLL